MSDKTYNISRPPGTMIEQTGGPFTQWLLINGNRWIVAALMLAVMFVIVLLLGAFGPPAVEQLLLNKFDGSLFGSLLTAIITTVTLVLTFSQFTLAQDFQNLGASRNELNKIIKFRRDVGNKIGLDFSPAIPREFIFALLKGVEDKLGQLGQMFDKDKTSFNNNSEGLSAIKEYIQIAINYSKKERQHVKEAKHGSFTGLLSVINHNYSWKFFVARQLRQKYSGSLPKAAKDAFEELLETLKFFGPLRDYFKTLFVQDEVIQVSRDILYTSLPTLALAGYMAWMFIHLPLPDGLALPICWDLTVLFCLLVLHSYCRSFHSRCCFRICSACLPL